MARPEILDNKSNDGCGMLALLFLHTVFLLLLLLLLLLFLF
jgi:hypothetical protein